MFVDINYIDMWNWCLRWSTSTWNSIYFIFSWMSILFYHVDKFKAKRTWNSTSCK